MNRIGSRQRRRCCEAVMAPASAASTAAIAAAAGTGLVHGCREDHGVANITAPAGPVEALPRGRDCGVTAPAG